MDFVQAIEETAREAQEAQERLDRVLELHQQRFYTPQDAIGYCVEDQHQWPCDTARAARGY